MSEYKIKNFRLENQIKSRNSKITSWYIILWSTWWGVMLSPMLNEGFPSQ